MRELRSKRGQIHEPPQRGQHVPAQPPTECRAGELNEELAGPRAALIPNDEWWVCMVAKAVKGDGAVGPMMC